MKNFKVKVYPEAIAEIKDAASWYNQQQPGQGKKFQKTVIKQINGLGKDPYTYAIRYNHIRCMIVKKFPYMVHFYIHDELNTLEVLAVINTSRNPEIWVDKTM